MRMARHLGLPDRQKAAANDASARSELLGAYAYAFLDACRVPERVTITADNALEWDQRFQDKSRAQTCPTHLVQRGSRPLLFELAINKSTCRKN